MRVPVRGALLQAILVHVVLSIEYLQSNTGCICDANGNCQQQCHMESSRLYSIQASARAQVICLEMKLLLELSDAVPLSRYRCKALPSSLAFTAGYLHIR